MPSVEWWLIYLLLGASVGFVGGLLGVGGGGILVPMLASLFIMQDLSAEFNLHMALATSLAVMVFSSFASARSHASRKTIQFAAVKYIAPGIALAAFLSTFVATKVSSDKIAIIYVVFMLLVAIQMWLDWQPIKSSRGLVKSELLIVGSLIGFISAIAAVGGSFLSLLYLTFKNMSMKNAIATTSALNFTIALAASLGYWINGGEHSNSDMSLGFIYLPAFFAIALSSFMAAPFGARLSHKLPNRALKKMFALLCLLLSLKMLFAVLFI